MRSGILLKMKLASLPRNRRKYAHSGSFQTNRIVATAISCLRDGQLNLALKRIDGTRFEPVGVVSSQIRTLIRTCVEIVLTFHFHCFVEKHLHDFSQTVKTFFRNDLQNRLRHAKFFHCDKSSRFVLFSGKVNKAVRRTYHIFFVNSRASSLWNPLRFYRKFVTQTPGRGDVRLLLQTFNE